MFVPILIACFAFQSLPERNRQIPPFKDVISLASGGTVIGIVTELTDEGPALICFDGKTKTVPWWDVLGIGLFREVSSQKGVGAFSVFGASKLRRKLELVRENKGLPIRLNSPAVVFVPRGGTLMRIDGLEIRVTASFEQRTAPPPR